MKRKTTPSENPIVAPEILEGARAMAAEATSAKGTPKCEVCSEECAPNSSEGLCWVCRRLKISAWKDLDVQMGAQE
jgi:Zn finger protein HypA/HybF involved in hydrogenase expression